ncbi:unnamed protein product [Chrysoparadoxa australica]
MGEGEGEGIDSVACIGSSHKAVVNVATPPHSPKSPSRGCQKFSPRRSCHAPRRSIQTRAPVKLSSQANRNKLEGTPDPEEEPCSFPVVPLVPRPRKGKLRGSLIFSGARLALAEEADYVDDGDPAYNTPENMAKRSKLRYDPRIQTQVQLFYNSLPKDAIDSKGSIRKSDVQHMYIMIMRSLYPPEKFTLGGASKVVSEEWHREMGGSERMTLEQFKDSMFELADMWTDTIDAEVYARFLADLFKTVTGVPAEGKKAREADLAVAAAEGARAESASDRKVSSVARLPISDAAADENSPVTKLHWAKIKAQVLREAQVLKRRQQMSDVAERKELFRSLQSCRPLALQLDPSNAAAATAAAVLDETPNMSPQRRVTTIGAGEHSSLQEAAQQVWQPQQVPRGRHSVIAMSRSMSPGPASRRLSTGYYSNRVIIQVQAGLAGLICTPGASKASAWPLPQQEDRAGGKKDGPRHRSKDDAALGLDDEENTACLAARCQGLNA